jgi:hypothetical protein
LVIAPLDRRFTSHDSDHGPHHTHHDHHEKPRHEQMVPTGKWRKKGRDEVEHMSLMRDRWGRDEAQPCTYYWGVSLL